MKENVNKLARIGAIMYVLWGILHIVVGLIPLAALINSGTGAFFEFHRFQLLSGEIDSQWMHARNLIAEHSFELIAFGTMSIIVAVALNWKNSALGFWLNFIVLGMVDVAFVLGEIVPSYIPFSEGIIGPVLYVLGAAFTGAGLLKARSTSPMEERSHSLSGATQ